MRKFIVTCKDITTNLHVILEHCSLNEAYDYLKDKKEPRDNIVAKKIENRNLTKIVLRDKEFLYDGDHHYLMLVEGKTENVF
jgi:dihydroorotase